MFTKVLKSIAKFLAYLVFVPIALICFVVILMSPFLAYNNYKYPVDEELIQFCKSIEIGTSYSKAIVLGHELENVRVENSKYEEGTVFITTDRDSDVWECRLHFENEVLVKANSSLRENFF